MQDSTRQNGFETVFQNSKDGLAIFKQGAFVDCNPSMLQLVGLTRKEGLVGKTPFDFSPPRQPDGRDSEEKGLEYINRCLEEGSVRFEWVHQTVDAKPFWAEVLITKMVVEGEVVIHANWRDISEKKELEFKLAEQKESFETLFNDSVDGLCLVENEHYTDCNKAFLNLFGFTRKEQIIGLHPADISSAIQADGKPLNESVPARFKEADDNESVRFEWKHKRVDGSEFWAEIIITTTVLNGKKARYISTRDISEKKELAIKLQQRNHDLNASNTELENMLVSLKEAQDKL
ncbi:MAG: PAS domain-containing protein, partial [Pseudomonadota bacterium]|nr:PAS domain-containing protein [Pseudomonadota bacterium]